MVKFGYYIHVNRQSCPSLYTWKGGFTFLNLTSLRLICLLICWGMFIVRMKLKNLHVCFQNHMSNVGLGSVDLEVF